MLYTKCILHEAVLEDGFRMSVMSRHTENDGITPDPRIKDFNLHIPMLGPHPTLIGPYLRGEIQWSVFALRYLLEIRELPKVTLVKFLAQSALVQDITILCKCITPNHCHRRLLAEECQKYQPALKITHL